MENNLFQNKRHARTVKEKFYVNRISISNLVIHLLFTVQNSFKKLIRNSGLGHGVTKTPLKKLIFLLPFKRNFIKIIRAKKEVY